MLKKVCKECGEEKYKKYFYGVQNECKDCTKLRVKRYSESIKRKCLICGKVFGTCMSEIKRGRGLTCSRDCFYKRLKKIVKTDKDSPNWKGDNVGNGALHDWIKKKLGKPKYCENCKSTESKKYEWANISREYKRDVSDWKRLCSKCHHRYDNKTIKWKKTVKDKYGWKTT